MSELSHCNHAVWQMDEEEHSRTNIRHNAAEAEVRLLLSSDQENWFEGGFHPEVLPMRQKHKDIVPLLKDKIVSAHCCTSIISPSSVCLCYEAPKTTASVATCLILCPLQYNWSPSGIPHIVPETIKRQIMNLNFSKYINKMADESLRAQMFLLVQLTFLQQQSQPTARLPVNPWI